MISFNYRKLAMLLILAEFLEIDMFLSSIGVAAGEIVDSRKCGSL